ncbi:MAG: hypothetical protein NUW37_11330 [Planctomycetes bacterium]|nr:hypothetical protein [Planctomycetota bacterium]
MRNAVQTKPMIRRLIAKVIVCFFAMTVIVGATTSYTLKDHLGIEIDFLASVVELAMATGDEELLCRMKERYIEPLQAVPVLFENQRYFGELELDGLSEAIVGLEAQIEANELVKADQTERIARDEEKLKELNARLLEIPKEIEMAKILIKYAEYWYHRRSHVIALHEKLERLDEKLVSIDEHYALMHRRLDEAGVPEDPAQSRVRAKVRENHSRALRQVWSEIDETKAEIMKWDPNDEVGRLRAELEERQAKLEALELEKVEIEFFLIEFFTLDLEAAREELGIAEAVIAASWKEWFIRTAEFQESSINVTKAIDALFLYRTYSPTIYDGFALCPN